VAENTWMTEGKRISDGCSFPRIEENMVITAKILEDILDYHFKESEVFQEILELFNDGDDL
jgi:hypothetical protein